MDDHSRKPVSQVPDVSRRSFMKSVAVTGALLTATALGVGAFPKIANAQDEFVTIEGQQVKVVKLTKKLDELDTATQRYRTGVGSGEITGLDGHYSNAVVVPREVTFLVTLNFLRQDGKRDNTIGVAFPKEKDSPTVPEDEKGMRGANIDDFAGLVKKVTGHELRRVQIILEKGTDVYQENGMSHQGIYYQAYILPIDSQGNKTTARGPGKYLGYLANYFYWDGGAIGGGCGARLITEPSDHSPVARR